MRQHRIKHVVPRDGGQLLGNVVVSIARPQPIAHCRHSPPIRLKRNFPIHQSLFPGGGASGNILFRKRADLIRGAAEQLAKNIFFVFSITRRRAADETGDMRGRPAQLERRFGNWPQTDLGALDLGQPFERAELRIMIAAVLGRLTDPGWNWRPAAAPCILRWRDRVSIRRQARRDRPDAKDALRGFESADRAARLRLRRRGQAGSSPVLRSSRLLIPEEAAP